MTTIDFRQLRVLIVDSNDYMRRIARLLLLGLGIRNVTEANDPAHAVEAFGRAALDVVFVDLDEPDLAGLAVIRRLRDTADSANPYVPIVAMSARAVRERVAAARDAGATEFLRKPFSGKSIEDRIANIILNPRPFVRTKTFFGPDRRRFVHPNYGDEERRQDAAVHEAVDDVGALKARLIR